MTAEPIDWNPWSQKKLPRVSVYLDDKRVPQKEAEQWLGWKEPPPWEVPKTLGACADALYETRAARLVLEKQAEELKSRETLIKDHIIETLPWSDAEGVAGHVARVTITKRQIPRVIDWDKLYAYVRKTKDFSLLQRRLADAAIAERWDDGKEVPGVDRFTLVGVSVNKL